ncbi:arsenate reductase (glutaredoxin) [Sulfidibacter corallicola]|uniref:Arsenate reductase (Glutaredoxin) n=1 Tax=Sulfidibacter corallicola TaxID=2818388 RepID=A0A8A4TPL7_SULCO|nr:arsenate reductase (glutaredoxin) [Sulfidibacter corallicola]QTD51377.1 arsenate reductase (glutaredoxin) [Sulfidibacter corallicola]
MSQVTIYHNPRCSKSRLALEILRNHDIEPKIVKYLETPPSATTLDAWCRAMAVEPLAICRTREKRFAELGLDKNDDRSRAEWLKIMAENPILIERPIVVNGNEVVVGRPPERVMEII